MKKYIKSYMKKPIRDKIFIRIIGALVLGCLYNFYMFREPKINAFMFNYPVLTMGFILIMLGWFSYLKFDGIRINLMIDQTNKAKKAKKKSKHKTKQMIDYADEELHEDQELLPAEKTVVNMVANLTSGIILIIPSIVLLIIQYM